MDNTQYGKNQNNGHVLITSYVPAVHVLVLQACGLPSVPFPHNVQQTCIAVMDTSMVVEVAPPFSPTQSHYLVSIRLVAQKSKGY